jgi:hypothetical protein
MNKKNTNDMFSFGLNEKIINKISEIKKEDK